MLWYLLVLVLTVISFSTASASIDPEDILRNLPSPTVNYPTHSLESKPANVPLPISQEEQAAATEDIKKQIEKIPDLLDTPVTRSIKQLGSYMARPESKSKDSHKKETVLPKAPPARRPKGPADVEAKTKAQKDTSPKGATQDTDAEKDLSITSLISQVQEASEDYLADAQNVIEKLGQTPASVSDAKGKESDKQPSETGDEKPETQQIADAEDTSDADDSSEIEESDTGEEEDQGEDDSEPAGAYDAVFVRAGNLKKNGKWNEIRSLLQENPEAAETVEGLRYQIEVELNQKKPNNNMYRRYGSALLEMEPDDGLGHYAMAQYYMNIRKPNTAKAREHLNSSLASKNPPEAASKMYWSMLLKRLFPVIGAIFAVLALGISKVIKKKKQQAALKTEDGDKPADTKSDAANSDVETQEKTDQDQQPEQKGVKKLIAKVKEKLGPLGKKISTVLGKLKKKKMDSNPEADQTGENVEETAIEPNSSDTAIASEEDNDQAINSGNSAESEEEVEEQIDNDEIGEDDQDEEDDVDDDDDDDEEEDDDDDDDDDEEEDDDDDDEEEEEDSDKDKA